MKFTPIFRIVYTLQPQKTSRNLPGNIIHLLHLDWVVDLSFSSVTNPLWYPTLQMELLWLRTQKSSVGILEATWIEKSESGK